MLNEMSTILWEVFKAGCFMYGLMMISGEVARVCVTGFVRMCHAVTARTQPNEEE